MKKILIITTIFIFLLSISSTAQKEPVPDFKVVDIFGFQHELYTDYLDQGKYVFIDFFTVNCGSCQELAPKIDTVYKEYGCNCSNLAFLGMTFSSGNRTHSLKSSFPRN